MNDSGIKIEVIKLQDSVQDDPKPIKQPEPVRTITLMDQKKQSDISFNDLSFQMESKIKPVEQSLQNSDLLRIKQIRKPDLEPIRRSELEPIRKPIKVSFNTPEPLMNKQVYPQYKPQVLPKIQQTKFQQIKPFLSMEKPISKPIAKPKALPVIDKKIDTESQKIKRILGKESDGYKTGYLPSMQQKSAIKLPKKPVSLSKFQALLGIKTEVKGLRNG